MRSHINSDIRYYVPYINECQECKAFRYLRLNGKAILPMILGLGCGTMAAMSKRILETKREKIIATFLIALAIPCSAQLGVVFGILGFM